MSDFLLDTNVCINLLRKKSSIVAGHLAATPSANVRICSVVKAELFFGARKGPKPDENLAMLAAFFPAFVSVPFDDAAAAIYGTIRADLTRRGEVIGPNDLMIAAIALANKFTLVTHNSAEFGRVSGLTIEDWETP